MEAIDDRGQATSPLPRKTELATKECRRSLDYSGQTISPVVTRRLAGFTSRCAIHWRYMNFRADKSCQIKDRATSSVSSFA